MLEEFTFDEFRLILLHELAHLKRGDICVLYLTTFLQKLHWFNPILWLAFQRANQDRELATDELVLREMVGMEKESYGLTLLKFVGRANPLLVATSSLGMADHSGDFSHRLKNIAAFNSVRTVPRNYGDCR